MPRDVVSEGTASMCILRRTYVCSVVQSSSARKKKALSLMALLPPPQGIFFFYPMASVLTRPQWNFLMCR